MGILIVPHTASPLYKEVLLKRGHSEDLNLISALCFFVLLSSYHKEVLQRGNLTSPSELVLTKVDFNMPLDHTKIVDFNRAKLKVISDWCHTVYRSQLNKVTL